MAERKPGRLQRIATSPRFWMWFHGLTALKWLILTPPGMTIWKTSVMFLIYVSLITALATSLAGFGAALAARKSDPDDPM